MGALDRLIPVLLMVAGPIIVFIESMIMPQFFFYPNFIYALVSGGLVTVFGIVIWPLTDLRIVKDKQRQVVDVVKNHEKITIDELIISTGFEPGTIRLLLYDAVNDEEQRTMIKSRVYMDTGTHAPDKITPSRCPLIFIVFGAGAAGVGLAAGGILALALFVGGGIFLAGILLWPITNYVENRLAKQRVIGAAIAHETVSLLDISSLTGQPVQTVTKHIHAAINDGTLKGTVREGVFVAADKEDAPTPVPERRLMADVPDTPGTTIEGVEVFRGCAAIGGNFEYKVKIQNNTNSLINKVTVTMISYPEDCMTLDGDAIRRIAMIEPGGFRSPQFVLTPTKDCVEGQIVTTVSLLDHLNEVHFVEVEPYVIKSVCDLLEPLEATIEKLEFMLYDMAANSEKITVEKAPDAVFAQAKEYLPNRNFYIIEAKSVVEEGQFRATIRSLAEGKYTHKKVAVRIVISGRADGMKSDILIEALCEEASMLPITIEEISQGLQE